MIIFFVKTIMLYYSFKNMKGYYHANLCLVEEFINVVSSDGTFVNNSHILLLVDVMTFNGIITSISRYGLKILITIKFVSYLWRKC